MQHSGVTARKGLWEVHYDPYDISRIWVRDHWNGGWITVFWTQLHRVAAPFGELAWDHARKSLPGATEAELAERSMTCSPAPDRARRRAGTALSKGTGGSPPAPGPSSPPGSRTRTESRKSQPAGNLMTGRPLCRHRPDADLRPVPRGGEMAVTPPGAGSADPVVQLTTLPGWRQFARPCPQIPHLSPSRTGPLEDGKRAAHDEERLEHHSRLVVVRPLHRADRQARRGPDPDEPRRPLRPLRADGVRARRTGKTTAVTQLGKTAEVIHRHRHPHSRDQIPVIYITVPPAATGR